MPAHRILRDEALQDREMAEGERDLIALALELECRIGLGKGRNRFRSIIRPEHVPAVDEFMGRLPLRNRTADMPALHPDRSALAWFDDTVLPEPGAHETRIRQMGPHALDRSGQESLEDHARNARHFAFGMQDGSPCS